jgi:hypothetical protein
MNETTVKNIHRTTASVTMVGPNTLHRANALCGEPDSVSRPSTDSSAIILTRARSGRTDRARDFWQPRRRQKTIWLRQRAGRQLARDKALSHTQLTASSSSTAGLLGCCLVGHGFRPGAVRAGAAEPNRGRVWMTSDVCPSGLRSREGEGAPVSGLEGQAARYFRSRICGLIAEGR